MEAQLHQLGPNGAEQQVLKCNDENAYYHHSNDYDLDELEAAGRRRQGAYLSLIFTLSQLILILSQPF